MVGVVCRNCSYTSFTVAPWSSEWVAKPRRKAVSVAFKPSPSATGCRTLFRQLSGLIGCITPFFRRAAGNTQSVGPFRHSWPFHSPRAWYNAEGKGTGMELFDVLGGTMAPREYDRATRIVASDRMSSHCRPKPSPARRPHRVKSWKISRSCPASFASTRLITSIARYRLAGSLVRGATSFRAGFFAITSSSTPRTNIAFK